MCMYISWLATAFLQQEIRELQKPCGNVNKKLELTKSSYTRT